MNRWIALALAVIGGAACALAVMMAVTGTVVGFLWIFIFGDDPWPTWVDGALNLAVPILGLLVWAYASWLIWSRLKRI